MADIHPPRPAGLPLLGNLLEARRDPLQFVVRMMTDYGDLASYRIGPYTGYLTSHPDYVRHILQDNHTNYSKDVYSYQMLKPVIGEGLVTSDGDHWLRQRRLIQPAFHRKHIAIFGSLITEATLDLLDHWRSDVEDGQPVDVFQEMARLTLRLIGEILFSLDITQDVDTIGTAFTTLNEDVSYRLRTVFVPPLWVPTPRNLAFRKARSELDRIVYEIIAERRESNRSRNDLLDMLLEAREEGSDAGMSDQQLRDEAMTLLLAGHETTATALAWIWYLLSTHPTEFHRLIAELERVLGDRVPTVDDVPALEHTERVIQEALRLYPPIWIVGRSAIADDRIASYIIPAGSVVLFSQYAIHRHPGFWENPMGFDPDRFAPARSAGRHPYAYFPFGGGPRLCLGGSLSMLEMQLIVATIAQNFRLDLVPGHSVLPEPLVTLRPRHGMPMNLYSRRS